MLGNRRVGDGPTKVVVLNDWMADTSTWEDAQKYLDGERFSWAFTDLRGYGRSKSRTGRFTVEEAADDVTRATHAWGWQRFAVVGHSMSSLVAVHLAQRLPSRVTHAVALTPPPPVGMGSDDGMVGLLQNVARGDDTTRMTAIRTMLGDHLSEGWARYKASRWRTTADPEAAAGYVPMFFRDGLPDPSASIQVPLLAVTGEQDAEPMRSEAVRRFLSPLCEQLTVRTIRECGHYPMLEAPPLLVSLIEQFLGGPAAESLVA